MPGTSLGMGCSYGNKVGQLVAALSGCIEKIYQARAAGESAVCGQIGTRGPGYGVGDAGSGQNARAGIERTDVVEPLIRNHKWDDQTGADFFWQGTHTHRKDA